MNITYKTEHARQETINKAWFVINAEDQVLGRLASKAAIILRGKHKTSYSPHVDCGDNIIIVNAEKVKLTGAKWTDKEYIRHSGYPGGQKKTTPRQLAKTKPTMMVEEAIRGMLPKNRLGREIFRNLHVYAGPTHPHEAQKPIELNLNSIK